MEWNLSANLLKEYDEKLSRDGIDGERLAARLHEISKIGLTSDGGSHRTGFSNEEKRAKDLVKGWMKKARLEIYEDGAGNVFGRLEGKNPKLPSVLSGSHVDSVPNGGHFDGPLGVLSALEIVEAWNKEGFQPERSYEVVIFTDEEGSRFNSGLTGSRAMTGEIEKDVQYTLMDQKNKPFEKVLDEAGLSASAFFEINRDLNEISHFVEVHIEQGKLLEQYGQPTGIVSGIAGPLWLDMSFEGEAGHAGNTPMNDRRDALVAAGEFISKIHALPKRVSDTAVATVGKLNVSPNGPNVIPGEVKLIVDIRDISEDTRDELADLIIKEAGNTAENYGVSLNYKQTIRVTPVPIQDEYIDRLEKHLQNHSIEPKLIPSGAGHDALIVGHHLPVSMLFVRSQKGISHNPEEWSTLNDCVRTIHVLREYIESLTKE
nr:Zn-dependent hydrolase [Halobacillus massiliensis]